MATKLIKIRLKTLLLFLLLLLFNFTSEISYSSDTILLKFHQDVVQINKECMERL